jgi:hypothetical protein
MKNISIYFFSDDKFTTPQERTQYCHERGTRSLTTLIALNADEELEEYFYFL